MDNPTAELDLTHTAVLFLEPSGGHVGDTGTEPGIDEIPYRFEAGTQLTLAVGDSLDAAPTLTLFDEHGVEVARVGPDPELRSQSVTVSGSYRLKVEHPQAGLDDAQEHMLFLRPVSLSQQGLGADTLAKDCRVDTCVSIEANRNCPHCDLRNIKLSDSSFQPLPPPDCVGSNCPRPSRLDYTDANFTGATLKNVRFVGVDLNRAVFDEAQFFNVSFVGAHLAGASFQYAEFLRDPSCADTVCSADPNSTFSSCCLTDSCFLASSVAKDLFEICNACQRDLVKFADSPYLNDGTMDNVDFAGAAFDSVCIAADDLTGSDFGGVTLGRSRSGSAPFADISTLAPWEIPKLLSSNLAGAKLFNINFAGVDLSRVDLSVALLSGGEQFADATLSDGVANGVNLSCKNGLGPPDYYTGGCYFSPLDTQFKGKNLAWAKLNNAGLTSLDLEGAVLDHAQLVGANLNNTNLRDASLIAATLGVTPGTGPPAASLSGAYMLDVDLTDADLRSVDLSGAHLYGTSSKLVRTQLNSANFNSAIAADVVFASAILTDAVFNDAMLINTDFSGAYLSNAKFIGARLEGADFSSARSVAGASLFNAVVKESCPAPSDCVWSYKEPNGMPYTVAFDATNLGAFASSNSVRCPDGNTGPCNTSLSLTPGTSPYPLIPACTIDKQYCYKNCGYPPDVPPDLSWIYDPVARVCKKRLPSP